MEGHRLMTKRLRSGRLPEHLEARTLLSADSLVDLSLETAIVGQPSLAPDEATSSEVFLGDESTFSAASIDVRMPEGNYVMRPDSGSINFPSSVLNNPRIAGFVLRDAWASVNPAPGVYNWSRLDAAVAQVMAAGKQFKLIVFSGVRAPTWLYQQGAQPMTFVEDGSFRPAGTHTMPVPWDPVMLEYYGDLLEEMDRHFGSNPALVGVGLGGPTQFSLEMHLPREVMSLPGFSPEAVRGAWNTVLHKYAELFPNVPGVLHLANPIHFSDGVAVQVASDVVSILGNRGIIQHDALSAKPNLPNYNIHKIVASYGQSGTYVGFEELCASNQARFGGTFAVAWQRLTAAKGRYLDLYVSDDVLARTIPAYDHLGDMDFNGAIDNFDIQAFVEALTNAATYLQRYPGAAGYARRGDANLDGVFDNFDIATFESLLTYAASGQNALSTQTDSQPVLGDEVDWEADLAFALAVESTTKREKAK